MSKPRSRNPEATRAAILAAAQKEFAQNGFDGARVERIVSAAGCNMRMLYHYFGSKEAIYTEVLESVYRTLRDKEKALDLAGFEPAEAMSQLIRFTWDHISENRDFIDITRNENLIAGRFVAQSDVISEMSSPLINQIRDIVSRGLASGEFSHGVDPLQLYISIVALCSHHISNAYTLSAVFQTDIRSPKWLGERRHHVGDMVFRMLGARSA